MRNDPLAMVVVGLVILPVAIASRAESAAKNTIARPNEEDGMADAPPAVSRDEGAFVAGLHHMAFLTADLDRLIAFYERIFDAEVIGDREDHGRRHALIAIGEHMVLHPFEVTADRVPGPQAMFERGRIDHLAFDAASRDAFLEIRRRLIAEGAEATEGGLVTHMGGSVWSFSFHDPDGMWAEVMWMPPEASFADIKRPPEWEMIDPEPPVPREPISGGASS